MTALDPTTVAGARAVLEVALGAAREAADFVHRAYRTGVRAEHKSRIDLVTEYDRGSERLLRARLTRESPFPVVGEELGGDRAPGEDEATWFVDPIDGTTNYVHGHPFYCVSVGLLVGHEPVVGAIVAPSLNLEWAGFALPRASGRMPEPGDVTRSGEPCAVSRVDALVDALLATGFPYDRATSADNNFDAFSHIKRRCQAVRRCGSAALDLCLVADGTYDGYWEKKLNPWDVAAGAALVLGSGGRITTYFGDRPDLLTGQVLATNGRIHEQLVEELRQIPSSHLPPVRRA